MASTIKLKNGSGAPTSGQLVQGEPALDLTNKRLYTENASGTVIEVGTNPSSLTIGGTALTATAAELNTLDGITATTAELNTLDGITATVTELNYTDGVTSNIQTQLNTKAPIASPTFTGTVTAPAVNVNGTVTADGLTVDSSTTAQIDLNDRNGTISTIKQDYTGLTIDADANNAYASSYARIRVDGVEGFRLSTGNDISFYEDTGTTAKFFWDASAESLGIGYTPSYALDVYSGTASSNVAHFVGGTGSSRGLVLGTTIISGNNDAGVIYNANHTSGTHIFQINGAGEAARIDSSGNLLVNTTESNAATFVASSTDEGMAYYAGGVFAVNNSGSSYAATFNRMGTDGDVVLIRKDGTTVGSIATVNGDMFVGTGNTALRFTDSAADIRPVDSAGANLDATTNLGASATRFKDLYLSGGVYLGGTGAANHLDDYEEGTFTPVIEGTTTAGSGTYTSQFGKYTKVGNAVTVSILLNWSAHTGTGNLQLGGLPFTSTSDALTRTPVALYHALISMTAANTMQGVITNSSTKVQLRQIPTGGGSDTTIPMDTSGLIEINTTYHV